MRMRRMYCGVGCSFLFLFALLANVSFANHQSAASVTLLLGLENQTQVGQSPGQMYVTPSELRTLRLDWKPSTQQLNVFVSPKRIVTSAGNDFREIRYVTYHDQKLSEWDPTSDDVYRKYAFMHTSHNLSEGPLGEKIKPVYTKVRFEDLYDVNVDGNMGGRFINETEFPMYIGNGRINIIRQVFQTGGGTFHWMTQEVDWMLTSELSQFDSRLNRLSVPTVPSILGLAQELKPIQKRFNKWLIKDRNYESKQEVRPKNLIIYRANAKWQTQIPVVNVSLKVHHHDS